MADLHQLHQGPPDLATMADLLGQPNLDVEPLLSTLEFDGQVPGVAGSVPRTLGAPVMAQAVVAAERAAPGKRTQNLQIIFPGTGAMAEPTDLDVRVLHEGRAFAVVLIGFTQAAKTYAHAQVTLTVEEPDFLTVRAAAPEVPGPADCPEQRLPVVPAEIRQVPSAPGELRYWARSKAAAGDPMLSRALLAWLVEPAPPLAAMNGRPVEMLKVVRGPVLLSQSVTITGPVDLGDWVLVCAETTAAAGGREHTQIRCYAEGSLIATSEASGLLRAARP